MKHFSKRCVVCLISGFFLFVTAARAQQTDTEKAAARQKDPGTIRYELDQILNPSLKNILQLDPSLMLNPAYLQSYPRLAEFLNEHPEVAHNPTFFLGLPESRIRPEPIFAIIVAMGVIGIVLWVTRLVVDYRRWLRISRLQTDAQAKILDRFTSNEDLLGFIQTPAGRRFMESSAIPIEPRAMGAPFGRILWSVQIGLVLLFAGIAMELLKGSSAIVTEELREFFLVVGALAIAIGLGFVLSGFASYFLSRRFGLLNPDSAQDGGPPQTRTSS